MIESDNQFDGWLKFFYVLNWIAAIIVGLGLISLVSEIFSGKDLTEWAEFSIGIVYCAVYLIICISIIKIMKYRDATIPNRIVLLITWSAIITIVLFVCEGLFYFMTQEAAWKSIVSEKAEGLLILLIWYLIWVGYFARSKRVFSFYGMNAGIT